MSYAKLKYKKYTDDECIILSNREVEEQTNAIEGYLRYYTWGLLNKDSNCFVFLSFIMKKRLKKSFFIKKYVANCIQNCIIEIQKIGLILNLESFNELLFTNNNFSNKLSKKLDEKICSENFPKYLYETLENMSMKGKCGFDHRDAVNKQFLMFKREENTTCFDKKQCYWHNPELKNLGDNDNTGIYRSNVCKFRSLQKDFIMKIMLLTYEGNRKLFECKTLQLFPCCGYLIIDKQHLAKISPFDLHSLESVSLIDFKNAKEFPKHLYKEERQEGVTTKLMTAKQFCKNLHIDLLFQFIRAGNDPSDLKECNNTINSESTL
ncbi:hypothetical protein EDEG_00990 [Edhazardia aedis USNM 41457]|uniref:Uncharacterized protein n=1 Tax=Edhazardia aedis (strain USNM 41457) TaxID=1003232 RepID=J9DQH8_EDHAE|nr:hypothetical protein EDEG_00990 [Edhazardia aedis USNM 41457]|eukprot:EJW04820.1 hypothetical protein EDEG_00990 [Edhazardia aedis USNM 41457]